MSTPNEITMVEAQTIPTCYAHRNFIVSIEHFVSPNEIISSQERRSYNTRSKNKTKQ
jgi:hypothetical protein